MKDLDQILKDLKGMKDPAYISRMEYFGIRDAPKILGIKNAYLKPYAKEFGRNQPLANLLWEQPIHECKQLAIHIAESKNFTEELADKWTAECYSWDLVDGIAMKILPKTSYAFHKIEEWSRREAEYEKRMAFALMVGISIHCKKEPDARIAEFFPIIEREAWDDRNFVKKAVNWALRQIGKRSLQLNAQAIEVAERIRRQGSKPAKWIATDALRELKSDKIQERLRSKKS
ncbi:MAG: DNA alkylation repair protein [Ekhidna sp.]